MAIKVWIPSSFWRVTTYVLIVCLIGSDPRLDFFTLHAYAQCNIPTNPSTDTIRVTNYTYDFDGHLTQVNCPEGVINYGYDLATGRHISTCTTNTYVAYDYDELGRLKTVSLEKLNSTNISAQVTTYTYTEVGNRASVTLPNGVVTTYGYDSPNRLTGLTNSLGGTNLLSSFTYQLHPTGRRTNALEILKTEDTDIPWITNTFTWSYDQMYRLTNEALVCSSATNSYINSYVYDLVGNRLSKTHIQNGNTLTVASTFNENDQLLSEVTSSGGSPSETNSYAYDSNGSLIAKTNISSSSATVLYGYDLKNKLSSVTDTSGTLTNYFIYNNHGIRVRTVSSSGGNPTLYLIDENNHTGYAQILEELSARDVVPSRSYVIGDDVLAQTSAFSLQPSAFLHDGHGSTRQLADASGAVSERYNYDAYGTILASSTSNPQTSLLYCGEQFDATLGMYNLRARFYDPSNGRFNSMDSFRGDRSGPLSLHKYLYANADPTNNADPSGDMTLVEMITVAFIWLVNVAPMLMNGAAAIVLVSATIFLLTSVAIAVDESYYGNAPEFLYTMRDASGSVFFIAYWAYELAEGIALTPVPRQSRTAPAQQPTRVWRLSRSQTPQSAKHAEEFMKSRGGSTMDITINRSQKVKQRAIALEDVPRIPKKDRDEFPPAISEQGGINASVRHIDPSDNRSAGASMRHQLKDVKDGETVRVEVVD